MPIRTRLFADFVPAFALVLTLTLALSLFLGPWTQGLYAAPSLVYLKAPQGEVAPDSLVQLAVTRFPLGSKAPDSCQVFKSTTARGDTLAGHTPLTRSQSTLSSDSSARVLSFKPSDADAQGAGQLGLGFHYLIVGCQEGKFVSPEIPFWVTSKSSPVILTPKSEETSFSPNISWTPVPGVPAYHLFLSDQALNIDAEKGTVSGASIIWQAITTKPSIAYGTPDPSGNFAKVPAPPLSPNVPYNLVVLNNYDGRSALATSSKAQGLRLFTIKNLAAPLSTPINLEPKSNVILSASKDSSLRFLWSQAKSGKISANTYKLYIYSLESQDNVDLLIPIFQTEVTDTFAVIDAKRVLLSKRYVWKVFALSDAGQGIVGDTTSFQYRNAVQTLSIKTQTLGLSGDTLPLGDVRIEVIPLEGSANALPLFSLSNGEAERVLAVGSYRLDFSKNGYLSQSRNLTLELASPLRMETLLPTAACRITGRIQDADGRDLDNANIMSVGSNKTASTLSDAQGFFLLGLEPGTVALSFSKSDYQSPRDSIITISAGKSLDIGTVTLARPSGTLSGTVNNDKGSPLAACQIQIKSLNGTLIRSMLTDDKGSFSAFLTPGNYVVGASRTGFTSDEKSIQLSEAVQISLTLGSGASLVKGRISLLTRKSPMTQQSSPLAGARIDLIADSPGTSTQTLTTDLHGDFSLSCDTGSYTLKASYPSRAWPDSVKFRVNAARTTLTQDLALEGLASILGNLSISPDSTLEATSTSLSLLKIPGLELFMTTTPQANPVVGGAGNMTFAFEGIPDGKYRVTCGRPGYGLETEPEVTLADGLWKTDLNMVLKKATQSLTFALMANGASTPGSIRLLTPQLREIRSGDKLASAAAGTYTLQAMPDSGSLIPLSRFIFALPSGGPADTTLTLGLPFAHQPGPLRFTTDRISGHQVVEINLDARARIDSMTLMYGYGTPTDTFQVSAFDLAGPPGPKTLTFSPGPEGGLLTYYFIIHTGNLIYSNQEPAFRFRAEVEPSHRLAALKITLGDSLRLPAMSRSEITLHAYDAGGNRLDSAVDLRGSLLWSSNSAFPAILGKKTRRNLQIQTEAAPVASVTPVKPISSSAKSKSRVPDAARWDTLRVTVTLDSVEKALEIPVQVVSTRINKLLLSTTLGEVSELPAPTSFGLFITGLDTTTTPPTVMLPHPEMALIPPQAGVVKEMQVTLHENFIGPLRVLAKQVNADASEIGTELGLERDSLQRGLNIGQTLRSGDSARPLFHDTRFQLRIPDSAFGTKSQIGLRMYKRNVAKTFSSGKTEVVAGSLYEITNPSGGVFTKPPRLTIAVPTTNRLRKNRLQRFDTHKLAWQSLDSARLDSAAFSFSSDLDLMDGHYYGLLSESQSLTAGRIEVVPNPFSPLVLARRDGNTQYGARIRLYPESDLSAEVTLTLRIYNLDGEIVRHLIEHKTVPKTAVDFYWDGKTDQGRWARNGRYLIKISALSTGTSEVKYQVRPVVLFQ